MVIYYRDILTMTNYDCYTYVEEAHCNVGVKDEDLFLVLIRLIVFIICEVY